MSAATEAARRPPSSGDGPFDTPSRRRRADQAVVDWLVLRRRARLAVAAVRIATGLVLMLLLLVNLGSRQLWVGQGAAWASPARDSSSFLEVLVLRDVSPEVLAVAYVLLLLATLAFILGWFTRIAAIATVFLFVGISGQNPVLSADGDTLIRLVLLWMVLIRAGDAFSLDRRRVHELEVPPVVPDWLRTAVHNLGVLGLSAQVGLVFLAAGLDKMADPAWRGGTALFTTMQLPEFRPFPGLSDLLSSGRVPLALLTYATLIVQLYFVPALLHPVTRRLAIVVTIALNLVLAVVLGTVWTSLMVIAVTLLFVRDTGWARFGERVQELSWPVTDRAVEAYEVVVDRLDAFWFDRVLPLLDRLRDRLRRRPPS